MLIRWHFITKIYNHYCLLNHIWPNKQFHKNFLLQILFKEEEAFVSAFKGEGILAGIQHCWPSAFPFLLIATPLQWQAPWIYFHIQRLHPFAANYSQAHKNVYFVSITRICCMKQILPEQYTFVIYIWETAFTCFSCIPLTPNANIPNEMLNTYDRYIQRIFSE